MALSTPSLGITRTSSQRALLCRAVRHFQLPLSGSHPRDLPAEQREAMVSFQLPLSGSRARIVLLNNIEIIGTCFQLPLSGSHRGQRGNEGDSALQTFNSLSRDHVGHMNSLPPSPSGPTFNSLSRDHKPGKTLILQPGRHDFQLPLSGSRKTLAKRILSAEWEAFNSLSRDHTSGETTDGVTYYLSTPSLGITVFFRMHAEGRDVVVCSAFNSLSRDHKLSPADIIVLLGDLIELSTPSLGITEPDSGIFRLSAAFCRGASSHK